jgi:hypothetical protein
LGQESKADQSKKLGYVTKFAGWIGWAIGFFVSSTDHFFGEAVGQWAVIVITTFMKCYAVLLGDIDTHILMQTRAH